MIAFACVAVVVVLTNNDKPKGSVQAEATKAVQTSKNIDTTTSTVPAPKFDETEASLKIPNPCEVMNLDKVQEIVGDQSPRGPLLQTALVPIKACEWFGGQSNSPRLGVTIALSKEIYDSAEVSKISDAVVGEKTYVIKGYTLFGGDSCGKTLIGKKGEYSFSVAVCNNEGKDPSQQELEDLATDVVNSLP